PAIYPLSLHDALPIYRVVVGEGFGLHRGHVDREGAFGLTCLALDAEVQDLMQALVREGRVRVGRRQRLYQRVRAAAGRVLLVEGDRKSTRLNSSHVKI